MIHSAVFAWFPTKPSEASTVDGTTLTMAHELPGPAAAVSSLTPSLRTRLVAAGYSDASLRVFHVTSDRCLNEIPNDGEQPVRLAAFTPKGGRVVGFEGATARQWPLSLGFPEVSFAALFRAMWYEGYDAPRNVWQSSGGGDDFEPKLGMMPLVFGTLKATIYSLLFAVPCALVGDLQQRILAPAREARIKPAIEMMASLPSVVLGFVAALVIAPYVEKVFPAVLVGIAIVPFTFLLAAYLWQLLPARVTLTLARWRFAFICRHVACGRICLGLDRSLGRTRPVQRRPAIMARRSGRQRRRGLGRAFASRVGIVHRAANRAPRQSLVAQLVARRGTGATRDHRIGQVPRRRAAGGRGRQPWACCSIRCTWIRAACCWALTYRATPWSWAS